MVFLIVVVMIGAILVQIVRKYIFRIKEPTHQELWKELTNQHWFNEIIKNKRYREYMIESKRGGLLADPYYLRKLITHEGTREGFLEYLDKQLKN